jgi:hypothetical protein
LRRHARIRDLFIDDGKLIRNTSELPEISSASADTSFGRFPATRGRGGRVAGGEVV